MKPQLRDAINKQLELEFEAAHRYLAMALWLELNDLPGFAQWMRGQSQEERDHADKLIAHLVERDQTPVLPAIPKPPTEWANVVDLVEQVYEGEKKVTAAIEDLCAVADDIGDRPAQVLLQWFVSEQVEEEAMAKATLGRLRLVDGSGVGLLMVDQELSRGLVGGTEPAEASEA